MARRTGSANLPLHGGRAPRFITRAPLVAEVVHGTPTSTRDPARYSFAHGGKDGHPFPVDRTTYDHTIDWLRTAVEKAKIGQTEQTKALRRLADFGNEVAG